MASVDLNHIGEAVRQRFEAQKRVLSFDEYLGLLKAHPERHTRDASRYLRDCLTYFGTYEVERPWGTVRRFRMFDLSEGVVDTDLAATEVGRRDYLVGQERLQHAFFRILENFVREGRANRLVLLHGPNGSAKTTFAHSIMRGLERYSALDDGALYRFSWIFPRGRDGKSIGFGSADGPTPGQSYAHLPDSQIDAKLTSELREHPLLLIPLRERRELLVQPGFDTQLPDQLWSGQLGHKNRQIFEALITAYRGDLARVLAHVRVERYYISRRYRVGAVTIGPQMAVDASERQISADRSLGALPASLSSLTLYETFGDLVDASGGVIEYSDLLKRPLDAWKYLLLAIEDGEVALTFSNLPVNAVFVASSNEVHLQAFREHHEYNSFRGRLQLLRVPYLLDYRQEQAIYDTQIAPQVRSHVAPHATFVAALWAVLTRLRRSHPDRFEGPIGRIAADLTPLEKAELYARGKIPERLPAEEAALLEGQIDVVWSEFDTVSEYEGLTGASPREIRTLLLDAAGDERFDGLSVGAVLEKIRAFCTRTDYEFLRQSPDSGYFDHRGFLAQVRDRWLDLVEEQLRISTGLIEETQYVTLFNQYVSHVSYWSKKEKMYDPVTARYRDPDEELMTSVEARLEADGASEEFRNNLIGRIAGFALENEASLSGEGGLDYSRVFPQLMEKLRRAYYGERRRQVGAIAADVLTLIDEAPGLDEARREAAAGTLARMVERFGYANASAREAIAELVQERYAS